MTAFTIEVEPHLAERLNSASAKRRYFPFADDIIDWSVPRTDAWSYMPRAHSIFDGSDLLDRLDVAGRAFVERWEMTQLLRNIAHGEHLLNQGILSMLWITDQMDPSYRYLLHEVAEECQHMAMFNQWVRINDDIVTHGADEALWGQPESARTQIVAQLRPEAFWVSVLLFEFLGEDLNHAMRLGGAENLHPILVQIGKVHTAEEARHINYARTWLETGVPKLTDDERAEVQAATRASANQLLERRALLPVRWSEQLAPYMTRDEFAAARASSPSGDLTLRSLKVLLDDFETIGAIDAPTMRQWEADGVFPPA